MKRLIQFFKEASAELKKVSWPSKEELKESTMVVIITTIIISLFLGAIDKIISEIVKMVMR